jgi:hypothetical protein
MTDSAKALATHTHVCKKTLYGRARRIVPHAILSLLKGIKVDPTLPPRLVDRHAPRDLLFDIEFERGA